MAGRIQQGLVAGVRALVSGLAWAAGAAVLVMMLTTGLDVTLRWLGRPLAGAFDVVRIAGAVAVACALPYTTAVTGHVSVDYFFHRLGPRGRAGVNALMRTLGLLLFAALAWQNVRYGRALRAAGEVSATLQWPIFWIPYVLALGCGLTAAVTGCHLLRPGKGMIEP